MEVIFNKHLSDFRNDFTIEFNVKGLQANISEEDFEYEYETGTFVNFYGDLCFKKLKTLKYDWLKDWSFAGRSNGWFCLLCDDKDYKKVTDKQISKIETIVEKFIKEYSQNIESFYNN
jgi:hypothetical protein